MFVLNLLFQFVLNALSQFVLNCIVPIRFISRKLSFQCRRLKLISLLNFIVKSVYPLSRSLIRVCRINFYPITAYPPMLIPARQCFTLPIAFSIKFKKVTVLPLCGFISLLFYLITVLSRYSFISLPVCLFQFFKKLERIFCGNLF